MDTAAQKGRMTSPRRSPRISSQKKVRVLLPKKKAGESEEADFRINDQDSSSQPQVDLSKRLRDSGLDVEEMKVCNRTLSFWTGLHTG